MHFISPVVEVVDNGNRPTDRPTHTKQKKQNETKEKIYFVCYKIHACVKIKICTVECESGRHDSESNRSAPKNSRKKNEIAQPSDKHKCNVVCRKYHRQNENIFIGKNASSSAHRRVLVRM